MDINTKNKSFWEEIGVDKPSTDLDANITKFYHKYNKVIKERIGSGSQDVIISELKKIVQKNPNFLLEIFVNSIEKDMDNPDFFLTGTNSVDIKNLDYYGRAILRRLRKLNKTIKDPYIKPKDYPVKIVFQDGEKIAYVFKKYSKRSVRKGRKRKFYDYYIEKLVIINLKDDYWLIRTSFDNQSERRAIKRVLKMRKVFYCKEEGIKDFFKKVKEKGEIVEIAGKGSLGKNYFDYDYTARSNSSIKELIDNDTTVINDNSIQDLKRIKFKVQDKILNLQIKPYGLGISHLKLQTPDMNFSEIMGLIEILKKDFEIIDDTYIYSPIPESDKFRYIFNNQTIENPHLEVLLDALHSLINKKLIKAKFFDPYKKCPNKKCSNSNKPIEMNISNCNECQKSLIKVGSEVKFNFNYKGIKDWILEYIQKEGFTYKGIVIKMFNKIKVVFHKIISCSGKEFLLYLQEESRNIKDVAIKAKERGLPILFISMKGDSLEIPKLENTHIGRIKFSDLFIDVEIEKKKLFESKLSNLETSYDICKTKNFEESSTILKNFVEKNFDYEILEKNTPMTSKGRVFERLIINLLKRLSSAWVDLGQSKQNLSVPDGIGYFNINKKPYLFGFDAKLKMYNKRKTGLNKKEVEKQIVYIQNYRVQAKPYGGLKGWLIVIKSKEDIFAFQNSIIKLQKLTGFKNIHVIGLETLLTICDYYKYVIHNKINPEIFYEFFYKSIAQKKYQKEQNFQKLFLEYQSKAITLEI